MGTKLFVGGLPWATDDAGLEQAFSQFGTVTEARVIYDRDTGRSRGFGFVSFDSEEEAEKARSGMDGSEIEGRRVTVRVAEERGGGGGGNRPPRGPRPDTIRKGRPPGPPRDRPPRGDRDDRGGGHSNRPPRYDARPDDRGRERDDPPWRAAPPPPPPDMDDWSEDRPRRRGDWEKKKKGRKKKSRWDDDW